LLSICVAMELQARNTVESRIEFLSEHSGPRMIVDRYAHFRSVHRGGESFMLPGRPFVAKQKTKDEWTPKWWTDNDELRSRQTQAEIAKLQGGS
jgi:hypothetical protein